ncbi:helix-turn-helix protein [Motilibacter rhizosphaerae]|uniref:Helix-turn-helix protein n=1 Tax=Motilibacter rhizosphaerae TaxID=598652 RepID=A0A4Q7NS98_9ACTN|nr:helix-turn-helix transcriptional regulator [Motilibacter rhizosphaerae]RZS87530.1 helix-turn-helix protein [Motilibacter rhizosphaerae]
MTARSELTEFLRSRRARLQPEDVGLVAYGERRRVPGLRREELAQLAGVSASYYVRLEQGLAGGVSDDVVASVARALRLEPDERAHLRRLLRTAPGRRTRPPAAALSPGLRQLVLALGDAPVWVLGRWGKVLAWNRLGHALLAGHLDPASVDDPERRPSVPRLLFRDEPTRRLYVDWEAKARSCVAYLRLTAGKHPDDPALPALVGELSVASAEFARFWAEHPVRHCVPVSYAFDHPQVGRLTLAQQVLTVPEDPDLLVVATSAAPGSADEDALRMLASLAAPALERRPEGSGPLVHHQG